VKIDVRVVDIFGNDTMIEPLEYTDEERAELARYREEFRRYNLEAVRKQMGLGEGQ